MTRKALRARARFRTRLRRTNIAIAAGVAALVAVAGLAIAPAMAAPATTSIFPKTMTPQIAAASDRSAVELGIRFSPDKPGVVDSLQYYQGSGDTGVRTATLWTAGGKVLARVSFTPSSTVGWRTIPLTSGVPLAAGKTYVASYNAPAGGYPVTQNDLSTARTQNGFTLTSGAGVYRYGATKKVPTSSYRGSNYLVDIVYQPSGTTAPPTATSTPTPTATQGTTPTPTPTPTATATSTPTPTPTPSASATPSPTPSAAGCVGAANTPGGPDPWGGCWPGPQNTGYPHGLPGDTRTPVTLTTYTGPTTITSCGVVIDSKIVNGTILIQAGNGTTSRNTPCVTIRNSLVKGVIFAEQASYGPVVIEDTEVNPPDLPFWENIGRSNFFAYRVNSHGGEGVIKCESNCVAQDNWIHGMRLGGSYHYNALGGNGTNGFQITHNYATCGDWEAVDSPTSDAGCSAVIGFYGDFDPIQNITITRNHLASTFDMSASGVNTQAGYCLNPGYYPGKPYPDPKNVTVTDNVFARGGSGKCGVFGPTNSLNAIGAPDGDVWQSNTYEDGTVIARPEQ